MGSAWLDIIEHVLRPARPDLGRCLAEREQHLARCRPAAEARARAMAECEQRIHAARAVVFAADDGVVKHSMTELEREWRRLARQVSEAGIMELWASMAPPSWLDRKRFRDSAPASWSEAALLLAADVEGVEAAERAVAALRAALEPFGTRVGERIRFRLSQQDPENVGALLAAPLQAAQQACLARQRDAIFERARRCEASVHDAAAQRFPERPLLCRDLAHAALVDFVWRAAPLGHTSNPAAALMALWRTGYLLSEVDATCVTLELPPRD